MNEIDFACKILEKTPEEIAKADMDDMRNVVAWSLRLRLYRKRGSISKIIRRLILLNAFWIRNKRVVKDPYAGIDEPLRTELETYYMKKRLKQRDRGDSGHM